MRNSLAAGWSKETFSIETMCLLQLELQHTQFSILCETIAEQRAEET